MCACLPYEMEHLSEEFTNGSSSDATGNNRRFQAENLRQITIYQLMKPLKIIPPILLCPLSSALHYLHKHWLHSEERIWHESQLHCSCYILQSDNSKKKRRRRKKGYLRAVSAIDAEQHSVKERYTDLTGQQIGVFLKEERD